MFKGESFVENKEFRERRRYKRLPFNLNIKVDELFGQDYVVIKNLSASISVFDISKGGIGFDSVSDLPIGYYFQGTIKFPDGSFFHAVMHIVWSKKRNGTVNTYGAEFVGLAPFLAEKVDKYEQSLKC